MKRFFGADTPLFRILTVLMEFALMNLLFIACSLPVVTAGAAYAALTESLYVFRRRGEGCFSAAHFWHVFRRSLKATLPVWCIGLAGGVLLAAGIRIWLTGLEGAAGIVLGGFYLVLLLLLAGLEHFYLFLSGMGQPGGRALARDCALLSLAKFPAVPVLVLLTASPAFLLLLPGALLLRLLPVIALYCFSFPAFFSAGLMQALLKKLYPSLFAE